MASFDLVIQNGLIFDGKRSPRFRADIGIVDGIITAIGKLPASDARRVIDAHGLHVAPGFIDLHTHYDSQLFWDPYCSISGWHGVTSVVIGNCGFGFAPVEPADRERAMLTMTRNEAVPVACMEQGMPWDWVTFPEFLRSVHRTPKSVNVMALMPLTPLMMWTMGFERAKAGELPTDDEHAEMQRLFGEAIDAGARGFSAQRMGPRSIQRDYDGTPMVTDIMHDETVLALGQVMSDRNGGFIQYLYATLGEDGVPLGPAGIGYASPRVQRHVEELASVSGAPIIFNQLSSMPQTVDTLRWLQRCRERGLRIYGQGNTFVNGSISGNLDENPALLDTASLAWTQATTGSHEEVMRKIADKATRDKIRADLATVESSIGPMATWMLRNGATEETARYDGLRLHDIAQARNQHDLVDLFCDLLLMDDLRTVWSWTFESVDLRQMKDQLIDDIYVLPGVSDGGAHTKFLTAGNYGTGWLATYVRELEWLSLEEAHWRLSGLPAFCTGFGSRGTLVEGAPADILIYDYEKLSDGAQEVATDYPGGEWRLVTRPTGYRYVLVNGEVTIEEDRETGVPAGALL
jgi:N-acyl-D-aspartate/D-glutamate deacylase